MDEAQKKKFMIIVVVACLVVAAAIFMTGGGNEKEMEAYGGKMTWVICNECDAKYETDLQQYYNTLKERQGTGPDSYKLICKECDKAGIFKAVKCEKCSLIFSEGSASGGGFLDKCPDCGYSGIEEARKKSAEAAAAGE